MTVFVNKIDCPMPVQSRIVGEITRQILAGNLQPGAKLPPLTELQKEFDTTIVTITRAVDLLKKQGFVYSRHRRGNYVSETPPCLCSFGIVRPASYNTQFVRAIENELEHLASMTPPDGLQYRFKSFTEIRCPPSDIPHHHKELFDAIEAEALAGLIFPAPSYELVKSIKNLKPEMPCATSFVHSPGGCINFEFHGIMKRALGILAKSGRRRVACIINPPQKMDSTNKIIAEASQYGLTIKPWWIQGAHTQTPVWAKNAAELLLRLSGEDKPDAIIIDDDNLVPHATAGILASGVRVPDDVMVIAHANFPWSTESAVPVTRLGFNIREAMTRIVQLLIRARVGEDVPEKIIMPVSTEEEAMREY